MTKNETRVCAECACVVADVRKHRRWHEKLVTMSDASPVTQRQFIGGATIQLDDDDA